MDELQEKIRQLKNPAMVFFNPSDQLIPPHILQQEDSFAIAFSRFCMELLDGLKGSVPAVRFSLPLFALMGAEGMATMERTLQFAEDCGYYVLLDVPDANSQTFADTAVHFLFDRDRPFKFHGLSMGSYIGSDGIRPYADVAKESGIDLFVQVRTANRSASEIQDLMVGGRLVQTAMADVVSHLGDALRTESGYSIIGAVGSATSGESLQTLRMKYPALFLLVDGFDYPGANAKKCSYAFDRMGHGAVVCAGDSVTGAWRQDVDSADYIASAISAADRMKKNIQRYVTVL